MRFLEETAESVPRELLMLLPPTPPGRPEEDKRVGWKLEAARGWGGAAPEVNEPPLLIPAMLLSSDQGSRPSTFLLSPFLSFGQGVLGRIAGKEDGGGGG